MQSFFTGGIDGFGGCSHPRWDPRVRLGTVARCWPTRGTARCRPCTRSPLCTGSGTVSAGTGHRGFSCCSFTSARPSPSKRLDWSGSRGNCRSSGSAPRVAVLDAVQGERWDVPASSCRAVTIQAAMEGASALPIRPVHATTRHRCNPFVARLPLGRAARPLRLPSQSTCGSAPRTVCPTPCECLQHMYHRPPTRTFQPRSNKTVQLLASLRDTRRTVCIVSRRFRGVRSKT